MPDEVEVCLVCCEDLRVVAVGSCNHRSVCALCSVRMRQLIGDSACILCKRTLEHVVMTADSDKSFDDFQIWNNVCKVQGRELLFDEPSQAFFDDEKMLNEIKFLRSFACPRCPPPPARGSFVAKDRKDLKQHTETHHGVTHCALCVEFRKEFVQEQQMYKRNELKLHEKSGDQGHGPFKGHPLCEFCSQRFYDDNALWSHLRKDHFTCHICEKFRGIQNEFYSDYDDLEAHFRNEHHLCEDEECLAKKFVVFNLAIELQQHHNQTHLGNVPRARRQVHVPVNLTFAAPTQSDERPGRGTGGFPARGGYARGGGAMRGRGGSQALARAGSPLSSAGSGGSTPRGRYMESSDDDEGLGSLAAGPMRNGGGAGGRWAGAAGGGGGGRFVATEEEFPGLLPSASDRKKKTGKKKGGATTAAATAAAAAEAGQGGGGGGGGGGGACRGRGAGAGGDTAAADWTNVAARGHGTALMQGAGLGRGRGRGGAGRPSFSNAGSADGFDALRAQEAFPGLGAGRGDGSSATAISDGSRSDDDDQWQRPGEARTLGGRRVGGGGGVSGVDRNSWKDKTAREIMAGVREVVGEERFDVFRAHSGEYRRGEIDGSRYYELFANDFALLDEHALLDPIIDLLPDAQRREELRDLHEVHRQLDSMVVERSTVAVPRAAAPARAPASSAAGRGCGDGGRSANAASASSAAAAPILSSEQAAAEPAGAVSGFLARDGRSGVRPTFGARAAPPPQRAPPPHISAAAAAAAVPAAGRGRGRVPNGRSAAGDAGAVAATASVDYDGPTFRDTPTVDAAAWTRAAHVDGAGEDKEAGVNKGNKGKKGKKKGGMGGFGFEEEDEGKSRLIKVGSREEFDSIVGTQQGIDRSGNKASATTGGGSSHYQAFQQDKREQATVDDVHSAAEQFALRFL